MSPSCSDIADGPSPDPPSRRRAPYFLTLQDVFEEAGYTVHRAATGHEAIAAVETEGKSFSGVVTDIKLGGGPDGWQVARRARETCPRFPIVYTSGDSAHEHTANGVPDSIMVQKPFVPAQIITAISTLLTSAP